MATNKGSQPVYDDTQNETKLTSVTNLTHHNTFLVCRNFSIILDCCVSKSYIDTVKLPSLTVFFFLSFFLRWINFLTVKLQCLYFNYLLLKYTFQNDLVIVQQPSLFRNAWGRENEDILYFLSACLSSSWSCPKLPSATSVGLVQ